MKYWDSSAIVALLVYEPSAKWLTETLRDDADLVVWWGTTVECASAIARLERLGKKTASVIQDYRKDLMALASAWQEIQPADAVKELSLRLIRVHTLTAADSFQLAAAIIASEHRPSSLDFMCLDEKLALAARREGFPVLSGNK